MTNILQKYDGEGVMRVRASRQDGHGVALSLPIWRLWCLPAFSALELPLSRLGLLSILGRETLKPRKCPVSHHNFNQCFEHPFTSLVQNKHDWS